jgi:crotonobetainyl-CoA:carnitine CoA-transferase CaiB-like acyl-CoA transferase
VEARFWEQLCRFLECPEWIPLQYDEGQRTALIGALQKKFRTRSLAEWEQAMAGLDICCGGIHNLDEALQDDLFRARDMVRSFPDASGQPVATIGTPIKLSATPGSMRSRPVRFGENTVSLLRELGYSGEEIDRLSNKSII